MARIGPPFFMFCMFGAVYAGGLPDALLTPGAIDPSITQENIQQTVCVKGYTKTVRPPTYFTNRLKKSQIREYGFADHDPSNYEEDHLIPLSIGGHPTDERNLWPQARRSEWGADKKDQLEVVLYKLVCSGRVPLADAQREMAQDWISAWKRYVPSQRTDKFPRVD